MLPAIWKRLPVLKYSVLTLGCGAWVSAAAKVPVDSIQELIAYAKANPGKLTYGSADLGSSGHLAMEVFKKMTGTDLLHVPYNGAGPANNALIGGHVYLLFTGMSKEIVTKLNTELRQTMSDPIVQKRLAVIDGDATVSTPEGFEKFIRSEMKKYGELDWGTTRAEK